MLTEIRLLCVTAATLLSAACITPTVPRLPEAADQQLIDQAWPYALIAYNSYHRKFEGAPSQFALPKRFSPVASEPNDEIGLAYDIHREERAGEQYVIFAFRGTENDAANPSAKRGAITNCDWRYGNLSLTQHDKALKIIADYVRVHKTESDHLIFVGHSLGGGLAIHASYHYPGSYVFAFNSSPKFSKPDNYVLTATDRVPFRRTSIAQRFEVLKLLRAPAREANQYYLPVQCVKGGPIDRHAMRPLAACLTRLSAGGGAGAARDEAFATVTANLAIFNRPPAKEEYLDPPKC